MPTNLRTGVADYSVAPGAPVRISVYQNGVDTGANQSGVKDWLRTGVLRGHRVYYFQADDNDWYFIAGNAGSIISSSAIADPPLPPQISSSSRAPIPETPKSSKTTVPEVPQPLKSSKTTVPETPKSSKTVIPPPDQQPKSSKLARTEPSSPSLKSSSRPAVLPRLTSSAQPVVTDPPTPILPPSSSAEPKPIVVLPPDPPASSLTTVVPPTPTSSLTATPLSTSSNSGQSRPANPPETLNIKIVGLVPNPEGTDRGNEVVTLRNSGTSPVTLMCWRLQDMSGKRYDLTPHGSIAAGQEKHIKMNPATMPLNNTGDTVDLISPDGTIYDRVTYTGAQATSGAQILF